jgi:hypothetical protein
MRILFRPLFLEFSQKLFQLQREDVAATPAYKILVRDYADQQQELVRARILAFSHSTWKSHASKFQAFRRFCDAKVYRF